MTRRLFLRQGAALLALPTWPALHARAQTQTQTPISYGYSAVSDFATVFVGVEQGLFQRRGLALQPTFIPLNPTIIPGLQSGSLQIGGPTPTGLLQAVDAGLDLVVLGGGGVLSKQYTELGLVAKAGSGIKTAADCVGRRIGVPGVGALLHVTFRHWLKMNGVDAAQVRFVEAPFPQHADMIRGGAVDAVVSGGPFMARILESGQGTVAAYYTTFLPEGYPTIVHAARRDWAEQNPALVKAFRETLVEAAAFMAKKSNDAAVREALAKHLKLPPPVVARMQISPPAPTVTLAQLQWWAALMKEQGLLKGDPAVAKLMAKA